MQNGSGLELSSSNKMFILTPSVPRMDQQELSSLSQPTSARSGAIDVCGGEVIAQPGVHTGSLRCLSCL